MQRTDLKTYREKLAHDPYAKLLGVKLEKVEEGYARVSLELKEEFLNFLGYVHGGLIFSLADQAFAVASNSREKVSVALQMNINFLKAPSIGDTLIAEAEEKSLSNKIGFYEIKVKNSAQELIAQAQGIVYRKEPRG